MGSRLPSVTSERATEPNMGINLDVFPRQIPSITRRSTRLSSYKFPSTRLSEPLVHQVPLPSAPNTAQPLAHKVKQASKPASADLATEPRSSWTSRRRKSN